MAYRDRILGLSGLLSFWEFEEASGPTFADSQGSISLTASGTYTAHAAGVLAEGGAAIYLPNTVSLGTLSAGNNYGFESTAGSTTYYDPNADTADTGWTRSTGATNFGCVDDAVRSPTNASTGGDGANLSTSTSGNKTGVKFGTGVYNSTATYKLWVYAAGGTKRKIQYETSVNDGTSWAAIADLVAAGAAAAWVSVDVTSLITSQAQLDAFAARFTCTSTSGGGATATTIYAVYLEQVVPGSAAEPFTVETWVDIDTTPDANERRIAFKRGGAPTQGWELAYINSEWHFGRWVDGTEIAARQTGLTLAAGTYHVVGTYDGANSKLYVNGSLVATGAADARGLKATGTNLYIGSSNGAIGQALQGYGDAIAIYDRALTGTEVSDNYTAGSTVPTLTLGLGKVRDSGRSSYPLTTSGAPTYNGDGSTTIDSTDLVRAPVGSLTEEQSWIAVRLQPSWGSAGALPNSSPSIFAWADATFSNRIFAFFGAANQVSIVRQTDAGESTANQTGVWAAGDSLTVVAAWDGTGYKISLNGAAFSSQVSADIPDLAAALLDIGCNHNDTTRPLAGDVLWFVAGNGALTNTDASTLHAFGDTDPDFASVPGSPTMLWTADDSSYLERGGGAPHGVDLSLAAGLSLVLGKVSGSGAARGVDLTAGGPDVLALGHVGSLAAAYGIDLAGEVLPLSLGKVASSELVRGVNLGGATLSLSLGKVAGSGVARGVDLAAAGADVLALGKVSGSAAARGVDLAAGGASSLLLGKVAGFAVPHGVDLSAGAPEVLLLGKVASALAVRGINLSNVVAATYDVGSIASGEDWDSTLGLHPHVGLYPGAGVRPVAAGLSWVDIQHPGSMGPDEAWGGISGLTVILARTWSALRASLPSSRTSVGGS